MRARVEKQEGRRQVPSLQASWTAAAHRSDMPLLGLVDSLALTRGASALSTVSQTNQPFRAHTTAPPLQHSQGSDSRPSTSQVTTGTRTRQQATRASSCTGSPWTVLGAAVGGPLLPLAHPCRRCRAAWAHSFLPPRFPHTTLPWQGAASLGVSGSFWSQLPPDLLVCHT